MAGSLVIAKEKAADCGKRSRRYTSTRGGMPESACRVRREQ